MTAPAYSAVGIKSYKMIKSWTVHLLGPVIYQIPSDKILGGCYKRVLLFDQTTAADQLNLLVADRGKNKVLTFSS